MAAAAAPPLAPRLPNCEELQRLLCEGTLEEADIARRLTAAADVLLAGVGAFRAPSATSGAPLAVHAFRLEGKPEPVKIGPKTAVLAKALSPQLVRARALRAARAALRALRVAPARVACTLTRATDATPAHALRCVARAPAPPA
jgi:hypothetical protein